MTIIHFKILTLRTKCLDRLVIRMDHSNIKKINLMLNLMLLNFRVQVNCESCELLVTASCELYIFL